MFLPATRDEMQALGWDQLDVVLVTGDAYIDSPLIGIALIGKVLHRAGYRVGIIGQPGLENDDITRLGEPRLFWGVSAGSVDSMVANTTALKKKRRDDDYTPGGVNDRRPNRASIVYTGLIRRHYKNTVPIVLGGLEASLRRIAHYDYWSNDIRRSLLFDAKADFLAYGMGEKTVLELAKYFEQHLANASDSPAIEAPDSSLQLSGPGAGTRESEQIKLERIRGICRIAQDAPDDAIVLASYEDVARDKVAFTEMFRTFYHNNDALTAKPLAQQHGDRWLVQHPPAFPPTRDELDSYYELDFERDAHPYYQQHGEIRALETIRFSLATHRGCYGECNFCAIAVHQGRQVQSRSEASILREAEKLSDHPKFKGILYDGGSPTGNMYGFDCLRWQKKGVCEIKRCMTPGICKALRVNHRPQRELLEKLRSLPKVKKVFMTSGLRYDLVLADEKQGQAYLDELVQHHVSGQLKIAPEHTQDHVLETMGKPGRRELDEFTERFEQSREKAGNRVFMTYYLIAAHPGCTDRDMEQLREYTQRRLKITPEQVQIFTPLPSTWSAVMYWTEMDPFTGEKLFVEKDGGRKRKQKDMVTTKPERQEKSEAKSRSNRGKGQSRTKAKNPWDTIKDRNVRNKKRGD